MLNGCGKFLQYALFIVNFVLMVGGLLLLGVGIWTAVHYFYVEAILKNFFSVTWLLVIILSALITLLSFAGCCGAVKEIKCLLLTFFILLLLCFATIVAAVVCGFVMKENIEQYTYDSMERSLKNYDADKDSMDVTLAWDGIQSDMGCCGIKHFNDWAMLNSYFNNTANPKVPKACCRNKGNNCQDAPRDADTFAKGCLLIITTFVEQNIYLLAGIAIATAVLMVLSMTFSCVLYMII